MASRSQTASQSQRRPQDWQTQELPENAVGNLVHYLLAQAHTKRGIKRGDILEVVGKLGKKKFKDVISNATEILSNVYGIKLKEIDQESAKCYILINQLPYKPKLGNVVWSPDEQKDQILLLLVLSVIFMYGGTVDEDIIWSFLTHLDIVESGSSTHPYFGDVRRLLKEEFVFQMYLQYSVVPDTEPLKHTVSWGARAVEEVSAEEILNFVCDMYGVQPTQFELQYREVLKAKTGAT